VVLPPKNVYMYMPFPYCLLFGDIKQLTIEAVAIPIIGGDHKIFSYNNIYILHFYIEYDSI
ncbi:hypothetical protein, partial [Bacteroides fragilis]|uniref:hypothetical protein n=1 Tax=Bacteroides fragilis TaxID=817 RepID=UPI003DA6A223